MKQNRRIGVTEGQAKKWERLARIPFARFEALLAASKVPPSTKGILAAVGPKQKADGPVVILRARRMWKRLRALDADGTLDLDPAAIMATMPGWMLKEVQVLVARAAPWFAAAAAVK
jgi:hypothetical protein